MKTPSFEVEEEGRGMQAEATIYFGFGGSCSSIVILTTSLTPIPHSKLLAPNATSL